MHACSTRGHVAWRATLVAYAGVAARSFDALNSWPVAEHGGGVLVQCFLVGAATSRGSRGVEGPGGREGRLGPRVLPSVQVDSADVDEGHRVGRRQLERLLEGREGFRATAQRGEGRPARHEDVEARLRAARVGLEEKGR